MSKFEKFRGIRDRARGIRDSGSGIENSSTSLFWDRDGIGSLSDQFFRDPGSGIRDRGPVFQRDPGSGIRDRDQFFNGIRDRGFGIRTSISAFCGVNL